jgi:hypothetical protein
MSGDVLLLLCVVGKSEQAILLQLRVHVLHVQLLQSRTGEGWHVLYVGAVLRPSVSPSCSS